MKNINNNKNTKTYLAHIGGCFLLSSLAMVVNQALAQESNGAVQDKDNIEQIIVVSSMKREENIQDVPVSVAIINSDTMAKVGISDMEDLSGFVPNFEINSAAILPNLYVRGLGGGASHSIEQSVGRYVDDVYISRAAINLHPFMDIQSVEVLRGPQGTLFGKNTAAGALIVRTGQAQSEFAGGINLSTSSYSTTGGNNEINGYITGALSDTVDARAAFIYRDRDGFYMNTLEGPDGADREDFGVRLKLLWQAGENTTVGLKLEHMEYDSLGSDTAEIAEFNGPPLAFWQGLSTGSGADGSTVSPGLDWVISVDCSEATAQTGVSIGAFCPSREQDSQNITLEINHEIDAGTLTLISAKQDYDYTHQFHGLDMGIANTFRALRAEVYDGFSQEVRFTSKANDEFDYIVGAYFEDSSLDREQRSQFNFAGTPLNGGLFAARGEPWSQDTQTIAVFGQARFKISDELTGIVGGRWSTEDKDFSFQQRWYQYQTDILLPPDSSPPIYDVAASRSESKFTPSFTIQWNMNEEFNFYGSYSEGHKTGGFSDRIDSADAEFEFDAEEVAAIEFGAKTTLMDGTLNLNMAIFSMDIKGLQLAAQIPGEIPVFSVTNAADSSSDGLEVELFWYASDNLTLGGNFSYTDATYNEFIGQEACDARFINEAGVCDLSGASLIYAPENKAALFAELVTPDLFGGWEMTSRVDISYSSDYFTDITNGANVQQDSFTTYGASMHWLSPEGDFTISLIGKNLTEEKILAWGIPSGPNILAAMAPPREIALSVKYRF